MNLPIYRAKKIDSDEYVIGYHCNVCQLDFIISDDALKGFDSDNNRVLFGSCESGVVEIDKSTLAINFPDMLDSQGNKIFASLSNDGKGGDICDFPNHSPLTAMRNTMDNDFDFGNVRCFKIYHMDCKVIGIHK